MNNNRLVGYNNAFIELYNIMLYVLNIHNNMVH